MQQLQLENRFIGVSSKLDSKSQNTSERITHKTLQYYNPRFLYVILETISYFYFKVKSRTDCYTINFYINLIYSQYYRRDKEKLKKLPLNRIL